MVAILITIILILFLAIVLMNPSMEGFDGTCKTYMKEPAIPPISKMNGKYTNNNVQNAKFEMADGKTLYSGWNSDGVDFQYSCPENQPIVAYDYNSERSGEGTSIYGGIGPVYCRDGSVISTTFGKKSNATVGIKNKDSILSQFSLVGNNMIINPVDKSLGQINKISLNDCSTICNRFDICGGFSYNNDNQQCVLETTVDKNRIVSGNGRIYSKQPITI